MRKFLRLLLVSASLMVSGLAHASGELTFMPGYFFNVDKFDASRIGLYVNEGLSPDWTYSSWTGAGKVFLEDPAVKDVRWFSTTQDVLYQLHPRVRVGVGVGGSIALPTRHKEADAHANVSLKLW